MAVNKFRLIEEVRKRRLLWDYKPNAIPRNARECDELWNEIGKKLDINVPICKRAWAKLRMQFCNEANRIPLRIAKAKQEGLYSPHRKYYRWTYFDSLRFVADGLSCKAKFDLNFEKDSDSDVEIIENNSTDHMKSHLYDSSSFQTESDNDIEIVDSDNLDQMQTQTERQKYFDNYYESDNDIEIVENNNLDQSQYLQRTSPRIPEDDAHGSEREHISFKSYPVSLNSCIQDNECATISNDNNMLQSVSDFKADPELQIEREKDPLQYEDINKLQDSSSSTLSAPELRDFPENSNILVLNESEHNDLEDFASSAPEANDGQSEHDGPVTFTEESISSSPNLTDEDYSYLYSFLSQTKVMSQLQKMEFRANMKKLLVHIFPASSSVNILEKQLMLPEDNDLDRKFLISFWPFIKSMSLMENLQFRAKMADLVLQILSSDDT